MGAILASAACDLGKVGARITLGNDAKTPQRRGLVKFEVKGICGPAWPNIHSAEIGRAAIGHLHDGSVKGISDIKIVVGIEATRQLAVLMPAVGRMYGVDGEAAGTPTLAAIIRYPCRATSECSDRRCIQSPPRRLIEGKSGGRYHRCSPTGGGTTYTLPLLPCRLPSSAK